MVGKLKDMKKDGIVAHTAGQRYSLIALTAIKNLRRCGVTAHTAATQRRKNKVLPHWVTNSILAHPFVPGKEIAEALIIVFASMFLLLLATPLAPSMALLEA